MRRAVVLAALLASVACVVCVACLTTMNRPKITRHSDAPELEPRAEGCNVDILEGSYDRPHLDFAEVALDWPKSRVDAQGPAGAMATLRATACESGAFAVHDMRALMIGADQDMVYEGTLATLLDDNGKPLNLKVQKTPAGGVVDAGN